VISAYTTREVADLLGRSPEQIRRLARAEFMHPERGPRGEFRFSFQDVTLLRTAVALQAASIPARRVTRALLELRRQLADDRPLSAISVTADGAEVIARDADTAWNPESGQTHFDFMAPEGGGGLRTRPGSEQVGPVRLPAAADTADDWYRRGCDQEDADPAGAEAAYREALARDPTHPGSHLSLGFLLHQSGRLEEAVSHYRLAADADPLDGLAAFNLGVSLEDLGRKDEAIAAYRRAIVADPELADAHYNLGRLYEEAGERAGAFEHLRAYKRLIDS
jgi:tetratricopeptide (TPR) repeat protein